MGEVSALTVRNAVRNAVSGFRRGWVSGRGSRWWCGRSELAPWMASRLSARRVGEAVPLTL